MKKILAFILLVVCGHCVFACDALIYSTQCAYNKLTRPNGVISIEDYRSVVGNIINTISMLKNTCSGETKVDCCCGTEHRFESNCDLFLAECESC